MTNKEWLNRAYNIEKYIKELKTAYNSAFENAVYISPSFGEKVQKGEINGTEAKLLKCVGLLAQIDRLLDEQYAIIQEITNAICEVEDNRYRAILVARYVNFKKIFVIAQEQNYSEDHVKRLLREAIDTIKT